MSSTSENVHVVMKREPSFVDVPRELTVALVDWSQLIEDYLDNINISFEEFCREMTGGWMFGYIEALKKAGGRTVLFCVSARHTTTRRFMHKATGATICVLPAPTAYRLLRGRILNPYASTVEEAVGELHGARRLLWAALKGIMPYLSTPPILLRRELRREKCTVILCQDYEHERFDVCTLLGYATELPVFATFQGGDLPPRSFPARQLRRWSIKECAGLIVAPRSEAKRVQALYGVHERKIARIYNPLDLSDWQPSDRGATRFKLAISEQTRVAVWHGRVIIRRKGLDVLLKAWERLHHEYGTGEVLRLLLIGDGKDRQLLREMIASSPVRHSITWLDEYVLDRSRLRRLLAAADAYVFSSREEGFPVAPIEAMACGLPVVTTRVTGIEDIFVRGEESGGIVVGREDSAALAAGLLRVFGDEELRRRLGENARRRAHSVFSLDAVGTQLRTFFGECSAWKSGSSL